MRASHELIAKKLKQKFPDIEIDVKEDGIHVTDYVGETHTVVTNQDFLAFLKEYQEQTAMRDEIESAPMPSHTSKSKKKPTPPKMPVLGPDEVKRDER